MLNVLSGKGNGEEKDRAWGWKKDTAWEERQEGKTRTATRELSDLEQGTHGSTSSLNGQAKL